MRQPMTQDDLEAIIIRDRDMSLYWFKENGFGASEAVVAQAMKDRRNLLNYIMTLNGEEDANGKR